MLKMRHFFHREMASIDFLLVTSADAVLSLRSADFTRSGSLSSSLSKSSARATSSILAVMSSSEDVRTPSEASSSAPILDPHDAHVQSASGDLRTRTALLLLVLIFLSSAGALAFVYYSFPQLDPDEAEHVKFPTDIEDAKQLGLVLSRYKDKYFLQV